VHLLGAAAATSSLLGLDAEKTTHALAISLSQPNFPLQPGFLGPSSKLLAAGIPASAGIAAAYFARGGMTGEEKILEAPKGFWSRFSFLPLPAMLEGLGSTWVTDTLTIKTYPVCHYHQTALAALSAIMKRRRPFSPSEVKSIRIETTKLAVEATRFTAEYRGPGGEPTPVSAAFDLPLAAAVFLHSGGMETSRLTNRWLAENLAGLGEWSSLVKVEHDPALTAKVVRCALGIAEGKKSLKSVRLRDLGGLAAAYRREYKSALFKPGDVLRAVKSFLRKGGSGAEIPSHAEGPPPLLFPNRVTIVFKNGDREAEQIDLPPGSMANPAMESELRAKFLTEVGRSLGPERAADAYKSGLALETMPLEEFVGSGSRRIPLVVPSGPGSRLFGPEPLGT
jgi:2-methylcitrate dehydratase PrpD